MILALDTGNTHTVIGCIDEGGEILNVFRMETNPRRTYFEYAADIGRILELCSVELAQVEGAVISSVVPPMTETLRRAVRLLTGTEALVVGAGLKTGLNIGLDDPGTIAADLVSAAVGAKEKYPLPCVVISMSTATAFSVLDEKGKFRGGAIMPGLAISLNALTQETSLLPRIEITAPKKAIGTNTVDCMKTGVVFGQAGAVDGILDHFEEEIGCSLASVVATGGMAERIAPYCRHKIVMDENLLLRGLFIIWEKNRPRKKKTLQREP